jgi:hypothetical protein
LNLNPSTCRHQYKTLFGAARAYALEALFLFEKASANATKERQSKWTSMPSNWNAAEALSG